MNDQPSGRNGQHRHSIMWDHHTCRIRRFTPAITQVINLILTDVGRPLAHIASKLVEYHCLEAPMYKSCWIVSSQKRLK